jgi:hypothetical protein
VLAVPDDVDGGHGGRRERRVAQRPVEHRPQVLLELRRHRALDRPVPGVVRAQRELVDEQPAVAGEEELDGEQALDERVLGELQGQPARLGVDVLLNARGHDELAQHAVLLDRLDGRVGDRLPAGAAGDEHRELGRDRDHLLDDGAVGARRQRGRGVGA